MNLTVSTLATLTTTLSTIHNATSPNYYVEEAWIVPFEITLDSISLFFSLLGNGLLILSILLFKRLRRMESNFLILNLAICDVISTIFGMPFSLAAHIELKRFLFGPIGCKLVYPTMTYGVNGSVFTLVCIAIERFTMITFSGFHFTKLRLVLLILLIHVATISSVLPYVLTLTYVDDIPGYENCIEKWNETIQELYTIILILLQYCLPLPIMAILYSVSWVKIMKRNNKMIRVSEDYERKMAWGTSTRNATHFDANNIDQTDNAKPSDESQSDQSSMSIGSEAKEYTPPSYDEAVGLLNNKSQNHSKRSKHIHDDAPATPKFYRRGRATSIRASFYSVPVKTGKIMRKIKLLRKPKYISQLAYVRHRQTIRTLKMFTTIVIVFAIFALPNQLLWVFLVFAPHVLQQIPPFVVPLFKFFTYLNAMTNCWVYFAFNSYFRRAYKKIFLTVFVCLQNCFEMPHVFSDHDNAMTERRGVNNHTDANTTHESQQTDTAMQAAFNDMFQDHLNNAEKYQHLYNRDEEEQTTVLLTPDHNKTNHLASSSIANLIHAITPIVGEQEGIKSAPSSLNHQLSFGPHNTTILPELGNSTPKLNYVDGRKITSMLNLDHINSNQMVLRESIEKPKPKRRNSAAELRKISKQPSLGSSETPQPKRSVFSFLSPRISKRSDINAPVLETVPAPSIIIDNEEEKMFTISESIVQTATATITHKINRPTLKSNLLSKIPPLVLPKPKIHRKSTSNSTANNNDIFSLLGRREKLEQSVIKEQQRRTSVERQNSMKKLQEKQLVRTRSNSLEKRISRDFSSSSSCDVLNQNKTSVVIELNIQEETSSRKQNNCDEASHCSTTDETVLAPTNDTSHSTHLTNIPNTRSTPNTRKHFKRPDISALLQHNLSVPVYLSNEVNDIKAMNQTANNTQQTENYHNNDKKPNIVAMV